MRKTGITNLSIQYVDILLQTHSDNDVEINTLFLATMYTRIEDIISQ